MFNGIVESTGVIRRLSIEKDCLKMNVIPHKKFSDLTIGDSISVNGVCLTITALINESFDITIVPETIRLSNLGQISMGSLVNLERSIKNNHRINRHYVQGHVDATCEIIELKKDGEDAVILKINMPPQLAKYIVRKGYIALDGMSITVIDIAETWFAVTLIPHTREVTIANHYHMGKKVNVEVDILGKYVEKLLRNQ